MPKENHIRIRDPIRCRNDHLIAWIEGRDQCVIEDLFTPTANGYLTDGVIEPVLPFEFAGNGFAQFGSARRGCVFCLALVNGLYRRFLDEVRRIEVRLSGTQTDDVAARSFQLLRLAGDGDRR